MSDDWNDPAHPPVEAVDLGGGVWVSWGSAFNEADQPLIWHWCDRSLVAHKEDLLPEWQAPRWEPSGVKGHSLVSREPLHLEPSLFWPDCCGKHGFVRDGHWIAV